MNDEFASTQISSIPWTEFPFAFYIVKAAPAAPYILQASNEFCHLLGYTLPVFYQQYERNDMFFIHPEDSTALQRMTQDIFRRPGIELHLSLRLRKANANFLSVFCWARAQILADGSYLGYFFFKEQATILQEAHLLHLYKDLQHEVAEYDMLLESTGVGIIKLSLTKKLQILWCNEAVYRMTGCTKEQYATLYHNKLENYFLAKGRPDILTKQLDILHTALNNHQPRFALHFELPADTTVLWVQGVATFTDFDAINRTPASLYLVFTDITENIHIQDSLRQAKQEADQANNAKSTFLSSISHDLRTPLNGILGFTEIALKEDDPHKKQLYLQKIKVSADLLASLVNDTLELSRIESGKMTLDLDLVTSGELLDSILQSIQPFANQKNITLLTDIAGIPQETLRADKLKLQKILLNLLSNAIKYTPAGGHVSLSVKILDPALGKRTRRILVQDDGIGMHPDFLQRLYEPFSQECRPESCKIQGTGLGLAIVKRIVDLMEGTIQVESIPNRGTTFTIDLPIETVQAEPSASIPSGPVPGILPGKKLLLCEDNQINAEIAKILLQENGLIVDWAKDGQEGLARFKKSTPYHYAAILMDIRMPILDGYAATAAIRSLKREDAPGIPIIAMTADAFEEDIRRAKSLGMDGYITKPININKLLATLISLLSHTEIHSP